MCRLQAVCSGASGTVEHIDWSFALVHGPLQQQGRYILQSNDTSREVLHWDGLTGRKVTGNQRDCRWSTWTCPLGFPVLGIWPDFSDGALLRSAPCVSHAICARIGYANCRSRLAMLQFAASPELMRQCDADGLQYSLRVQARTSTQWLAPA